MKKIICALMLLQAVVLKAEDGDKTRKIIDTILQVENYVTHADKILQAIGSSLTKEEFIEKFFDAYTKKDFQDSLKSQLEKRFTSEQLDEIYMLISSDLYQKYCKEFYSFSFDATPLMTQLILGVIQEPQAQAVEITQQTDKILIGNQSNFESILKEHDTVIVDVYANWCGPCKAISPILQDLSKEFDGKCVFVKVDADANPALINKLKAKSLPTLVFYKQGKEVYRKVGFADKEQLIGLMHSYLDQ